MEYFHSVVTEYLCADRSVFAKGECRIELGTDNARTKGQHWYADIIACDFRTRTIYLCAITLEKKLQALIKRLRAWESHWPQLRNAVFRDFSIEPNWHVQPWVFIPEKLFKDYQRKRSKHVSADAGTSLMPDPLVTCLEAVCPWKYESSDRKKDALAVFE